MVHNNDLWGETIIMGFQGLQSSQVRDFALFVEISITCCDSVLPRRVVEGPNLILHFRLDHRYYSVEVVAEFSQVKAVEFVELVL